MAPVGLGALAKAAASGEIRRPIAESDYSKEACAIVRAGRNKAGKMTGLALRLQSYHRPDAESFRVAKPLRGPQGQVAIRILHVLPCLAPNGAERLLQKLVAKAPHWEQHRIAYLLEGGGLEFGPVAVNHLGMRRRLSLTSPFEFVAMRGRLQKLADEWRPDIVQGWLYYGNLATQAVRGRGAKILWTIHNTTLASVFSNPAIHFADRVCAMRSNSEPDAIIYCADSAREIHERRGYDAARSKLIPNGVDLDAFGPQALALREATRARLTIAAQDKVIGLVARFDRQKNIDLALAAIAQARANDPHMRVLLCGQGMAPDQPALMAMLAKHELADTALVLGVQQQMPEIYAALDLVVLASSYGEAMPMALLEALCVGVPIASTQIGDVALFPAPASALARVNDRDALVRAIQLGLAAGPQAPVWRRAFDATRRDYSLTRFSARHSALYQELVVGPQAVRPEYSALR